MADQDTPHAKAAPHTPVATLGEFRLINLLAAPHRTPKQPTTILGIGDDAALLQTGEGYWAVATDLLLEGIHFDLAYTPLPHLGYKAVVGTISDILAMNAKPTQIMIGMGISNRFSVEALQTLYEGIQHACTQYALDLVGGDTTSSNTGLQLSLTAMGQVQPQRVTRRRGAKPGDYICVTGDLGAAYLGLQVLQREKKIFLEDPSIQPDLKGFDYVVQRQLRPTARTQFQHQLTEAAVIPTAMIDVSAGLAPDLFHLAQASEVGVTIWEKELPVAMATYDAALQLHLEPTMCACNGGEDYELLFTLNARDKTWAETQENVSIIGQVSDQQAGWQLETKGGHTVPLTAPGWQHVVQSTPQPPEGAA